MTCSFKYDIRNFVNFYPTIKSSKILFRWASQSIWDLSYKNTKELSFMTLNSDARFEWILILWFQKWHEELGEILLEHSKSEKLYIDGLFLWKAYNVLARKFQRNWVMKTKGDAKFKRKLTHGLKNDIRNLVNFHWSSRLEICHLMGFFCPSKKAQK